jgi:dimethylargininase
VTLRSSDSRLVAVTRAISPALVHCELTHIPRQPIDLAKARAQHDAYEHLLSDLGCAVTRLPAAPDMADGVFIEDTAVVLDEVAIIARPGAVSRRAEVAAVATAVSQWRMLVDIEPPGTLDGGDVLVVGRTLYVGETARTNAAGRDQLAKATEEFGYEVRPVSVTDCLHLKSAVTAVTDETLLINPLWVSGNVFDGLRLVEIDPGEPFAANALRIGDAVIHAAEFPKTRRRLEQIGLRVYPVPASELAKAEGGVTCCSLIFTAQPQGPRP